MRRSAEVTIATRRGSLLLGVLNSAAKPFAYPDRVAGLVGIRPRVGQAPRLKAGSLTPPPAFSYALAQEDHVEDHEGLPGLDEPVAHGRALHGVTDARAGRAADPPSGPTTPRLSPLAASRREAQLPGTTESPYSPLPEPYDWSADDRGEAPSDASEAPGASKAPDAGARETALSAGPTLASAPPPGRPAVPSPALPPSPAGDAADAGQPRSVTTGVVPLRVQGSGPAFPATASRPPGTKANSDERGVRDAGPVSRRAPPVSRREAPVGLDNDPPSMAATAARAAIARIPASGSVVLSAAPRPSAKAQALGAFPPRRSASQAQAPRQPAPAEASEPSRDPAREAPRQTVHQYTTVLSTSVPTPPGGRGYWQRRYLGRAFSRRGR